MTQTEALKLARQLLWRYRHETPIGRQPHMICQEVDEAFERIDEALAQPEQEPVETLAYKADYWKRMHDEVRVELIKALNAQPEQELVAYVWTNSKGWLTYGEQPHDRFVSTPLYTTPPYVPTERQRTTAEGEDTKAWVGLTKDRMLEILKEIDPETQRLPIGFRMFADAIEAELKERNT